MAKKAIFLGKLAIKYFNFNEKRGAMNKNGFLGLEKVYKIKIKNHAILLILQ